MPTDLNSMHMPTGSEHEIFEPENAWPDAPDRVVVQTNKMRGGTYQIGAGETGSHWIRSYAGGAWTEWQELVPPPPPEPPPEDAGTRAGTGTGTRDDEDEDDGDEDDDEYVTTDLQPAKRGPGRPRKR
jgi:hypothetical protein